MLNSLDWQGGGAALGGVAFRLFAEGEPDNLDEVGTPFVLYKSRRLLEQYVRFLNQHPPRQGGNLVELGIFHGGSVVFWNEYLRPKSHVAIDIAQAPLSNRLNEYIEERRAEHRILQYWGVDQAQPDALRKIVEASLGAEQIDIVIDDASHEYARTKVCFERLFPLLRPGGLYFIEDWSWGYWPGLSSDFPLPKGSELSGLVQEILAVLGSMSRFLHKDAHGDYGLKPLIASVIALPDIVIVERGDARIEDVSDFSLDGYATQRP